MTPQDRRPAPQQRRPSAPAATEQAAVSVGDRGLQLRSFSDFAAFADLLLQAAMAPKGANRASLMLSLQHGLEVGLSPMQAIQSIYVVNGRPQIFGDAALALCKIHPQWGAIEESFERADGGDTTHARCSVLRRGQPEVVRTFSVGQAKKAGLWAKEGPWQQYPQRMLQMRARAFALRDSFPDALKGLSVAEEQLGIEPASAGPRTRALPSVNDLAASLTGGSPENHRRQASAPEPGELEFEEDAQGERDDVEPPEEPTPKGVAYAERCAHQIRRATTRDELEATCEELLGEGARSVLTREQLAEVIAVYDERRVELEREGTA